MAESNVATLLPQQDLTSAAIEDGQTLLERATEAWRINDLDTALALMARAYARHNTPEVSCYHATLLHYVGRSKETRDVLFRQLRRVRGLWWDSPNDNIHVTKDDFKLKQGYDLIHEQPDEI